MEPSKQILLIENGEGFEKEELVVWTGDCSQEICLELTTPSTLSLR